MIELAQWLEATQLGTAIRESTWWFPILGLLHLIGMTVAAGTILYMDLRLLERGFRRVRVDELGSQLLPWTWAGFFVLLVSGILLVLSEAVMLERNAAFRIKLVLLAVAGLNVLLFHRGVYRSARNWDSVPRRAKVTAWISIVCWAGLIAAGRAIPFVG